MFAQIINTQLLINTGNKCDKSVAMNAHLNDNNKRLSDEWVNDGNDWSESCSSKRMCNNEHNFSMSATDSNESQELYGISCLMSNIGINHTEIPEWPTDWLNDCCATASHTKSASNSNEFNGIFPPMVGELYFRFRLENCLKRDKRCAVFEACDDSCVEQKFVVKIGIAKGSKKLRHEFDNYEMMSANGCSPFVPKLLDKFYSWKVIKNGISNEWSMLVMEKLGSDLAQLMISENENKLCYELVSNYAIHMITCLEMIHSCGLLHRKVKPQHFVIANAERDSNSNHIKQTKLCLIGFGAAKSYRNETLTHIRYKSDKKLPKGDPLFHSINHFDGIRRTRRDDMESLGYCLVYLIKGCLPWSNVNNGINLNSAKYIRLVANKMKATSLEDLCIGIPESFLKYFKAISELNFEDKPDYDELRRCFDTSLDKQF